jgi:VRR-NUC domain
VTIRTLGPTESELHKSVANLLDWVLLPPALYSTFPSGWGKLSKMMAQTLRKSGLKPGMPDMIVFPGGGRCFGIELKAGKNVPTPTQREMFDKMLQAGIRVYVARSVEQVWDILHTEKVPVRQIRGDERWSQGPRKLPLGETFARRADAGEGGVDGSTQREAG